MLRKFALFFALAYIFTIPWETAVTIPGLGTLTRLFGLAAAGLWIASVAVNGKLRVLHPYHIAVIVFMLYNLASLFWTANSEYTTSRLTTYAQLAILTWIFWDLFTSEKSLNTALQLFILGGYIAITSQLINFAAGVTIDPYDVGRYSGAGQNAVEYALILSLSLPFAWHLATGLQEGRLAKILTVVNFAYIPLAILSTILTASRTSLITMLPAVMYIAATMDKIKPIYRMLVIFAVITALIVVWPMIPAATLSRLSTIGSSIAGSDLGGRGSLWKGAIETFMQHPLIGIGSNTLSAPGQLGAHAHNTFLSILAELGLIGFSLFIIVIVIVALQAINQPKHYAILWLGVLGIWMFGVLSLTWEYTKTTWLILSLIVISGGIHQRGQPEEAPPLTVLPLAELEPGEAAP